MVLRLPDPVGTPAEFVIAEELPADGKLISPLLPDLEIAMADLVVR
ncbi:MAG: hypothetical protein ACRDZO_10810 [Egibacteraceae bacterium]